MKLLILSVSVLVISMGCVTSKMEKSAAFAVKDDGSQPVAEKRVVKDELHGTVLEDPYRWLEKSEDPTVKEWTLAQNTYTEKSIDSFSQTKLIEDRMREVWNYDKMSLPQKAGNRLFFRKMIGLQNQAVLYVREGEKEKSLIDLNKINREGTTAMDWWHVSPKGKYVAYGLSENGSEQSVLHVIDVETGLDITKPLPGCRYANVGWLPDESGFYYSRKLDSGKGSETDTDQKVYFHKLSEEYSNDKVIAETELKEGIIYSRIGEDGKWLFLGEYKGSSGKAKISIYNPETGETRKLVDSFENTYDGEIYKGSIYLRTDKGGSSNFKVERVNAETLEWETFISEDQDAVLENSGIINGKLVLVYMKDVTSRLKIVDLETKETKEIELPVLGSVHRVSGEPDGKDMYISFSSFAFPPTIFKYSEERGLEEFFRANVKVDSEQLETKQVFYPSKDGTKIPMFIIHKKGIELNGENPLILYGYGGFGVSMNPYFSSSSFVWLEKGGVYAIANIRGGGEYGEKWHQGAMFEKKQNSFDDFAWAIKYLVAEKYTNFQKVGILGGSNGGLLTGAMVVQYPELFKAAVSAVPLLDMVRYHKFLIGRYWVSEYGSSDDAEQFKYILKYSPYQNVKKGVKYPSVFITAGEHDSRVHPFHAKKMAALLQSATGSQNPIYLMVEMKAGHGQGKSTEAMIRERALLWSFFFKELGVDFNGGTK